MHDGVDPEITAAELDRLLSHFTPEQIRLMAERWDELKAAIRRWRIERGEQADGDSEGDGSR